MNLVKIQLKWACRIEHLSAGLYSSFSKRYRKKENLSKTLEGFSNDEYRHGIMFGQAYQEECGKTLMIAPWAACGRTLAFSQLLIPLRWKLKIVGSIESLAVTLANLELRSEKANRYRTILREIKPDEERHANFYSEMYLSSAQQTQE